MAESIYNAEENLLLQSTMNAAFLMSLCLEGDKFLSSEFFNEMNFVLPKEKDLYQSRSIGIGNQGMMLCCLYSLLVLPKEKLQDKYPDAYRQVNEWIKSNSTVVKDTYPAKDEHIRHIRNAVAHGNVEIEDADGSLTCLFKDSHNSMEYCLKMPIGSVGELVRQLILAQKDFFDEMAARGVKPSRLGQELP